MRRLALIAGGVALAAWFGGVTVAATPHVVLPRDHAGHPTAGIEWWYVTGDVRGSDGNRYTVFFTLFSRRGSVIPVSQVVNLTTGALVGHTELLSQRTPDTRTLDIRAPGHHVRYASRTNTWTFVASKPGYALDLTVRPSKPYVLHGGGTGVVQEPTGGLSYYYSATRALATGFITTGAGRIPFTGEAWLDHQWVPVANITNPPNWDWFSCRFDDRTELMLYRFRTRNGTPLVRYRSGTLVSRRGVGTLVKSFDATPGTRTLDAAGRQWPLDWELRLPAASLMLSLHAIVPDQLVRGQLLPTFWEGASAATGTKHGVCFVEETNS
jgi:predicted secreted hydrolase